MEKQEDMTLETRVFDPAKYLDTEEAIETFLKLAFETGDAAHIAYCVGIVARARSMTQLARDVGMSRSALYKALSGDGNPEFATIVKVLDALGIKLSVQLASNADQSAA